MGNQAVGVGGAGLVLKHNNQPIVHVTTRNIGTVWASARVKPRRKRRRRRAYPHTGIPSYLVLMQHLTHVGAMIDKQSTCLGKNEEEIEKENFAFIFFPSCFDAAIIAAGREVERAAS